VPVSFASFKNLTDDQGNFNELYYTIARDLIRFNEEDDQYISFYKIHLTVFDKKGKEVFRKEDKRGFQVATQEETKLTQDLNEIFTFYIQPGEYSYELKLSGDGIESDISKAGEFTAPQYNDSKLELSQIEFCSNISTDANIPKFEKNNLLVYPNPSKRYALRKPIVFFYAEIYNLEYEAGESESDYELTYFLLDSNNDTVKIYANNRKEKAGNSSVIANFINARTLEEGSYRLVLKVTDLATQQTAEQSGFFNLRELPIISEKDAEIFRDQISYILDKRTLDIYDRLDLVGKQTFMENFWKERDPSPGTAINEFKQEYIRRWQYVNEHYRNESPNLKGWQTDRGRIYLIHGTPTDIERNYAEELSKDHEIWYYDSEQYGSKQFVFCDITMRGRLVLIHSQAPNQQEVYDPNWRSIIDIRK
jgi:GWxTD domain-containing protein